jgi:hypothetical protein
VWRLRSLKVHELAAQYIVQEGSVPSTITWAELGIGFDDAVLASLYTVQEDSAPPSIACDELGVDLDVAENDSVREDSKTEGWSLGLTRTMKCGLACAGIAFSVGVAVWLVSGQRPPRR